MLACMVMVGMPLRTLPFGDTKPDNSYSWFFLESAPDQSSFVRSWARWNYEGFEGKQAYAEYRDVVSTMAEIGEEHGCGRTFWEYDRSEEHTSELQSLMRISYAVFR